MCYNAFMRKKELALEIVKRLKKEYPDAACTLDISIAWKLLISVVILETRVQFFIKTTRYRLSYRTGLAEHQIIVAHQRIVISTF